MCSSFGNAISNNTISNNSYSLYLALLGHYL
ncbi:MAG: hypothetical protein JTT17_07295 [Candidatus Brockarchaeota archaeon]|nr:hypothetical protein [Candidatus Brockarchaeota archaeon]